VGQWGCACALQLCGDDRASRPLPLQLLQLLLLLLLLLLL
jgi:hypothetical protein